MKETPTYNRESFYESVFEIVRAIPKGRVTSYGAIAAALGARASSRMVVYAMNVAGAARPKVPAHRVVNSKGLLTGRHHFSPPEKMEELLRKEGVTVEQHQVKDFKNKFWDPSKELAI